MNFSRNPQGQAHYISNLNHYNQQSFIRKKQVAQAQQLKFLNIKERTSWKLDKALKKT